MPRRRFLQHSAALFAAGAAIGSASPARKVHAADEPAAARAPLSKEQIAEGFIDAHVHVWTPDTDRWPLAPGFSASDMQPPSFTPEELFAQAEPNGVTRIVLIQMSFYGTDNRYMLDAMRRFPGRFSGVGRVDDAGADPAAAMRELAAQGVRGFRITPGNRAPEEFLTSAGELAMWQCAAEEKLAICPLINPQFLASVERMAEKFQDTTVVIDHFARIGIDGEIHAADLDQLCGLARFPKVHVKTSAFYALGKKQAPYTDLRQMIKRLVGAYGARRLMWATDCPYQVQNGHTYADSIALVRDRLNFLSDADRQDILRNTAQRVFFS